MAKKSGSRLIQKEAGTQNKKHHILSDEITLRDEIFELKRQAMILKKTNEQYLVKLRKFENEAKRKDKQLERLMDPRKNSDITKVLSTKGAAILMNLKDQNNALIQMIVNKDLHIRRLVAEIKMSKLYASTKKSEGYRAEISRLRNLLIKSQETLKENVDVHEQSRSICMSGNSLLEFSSSSDQSSPRDLDELRLTILNLESHIEQSNDLLAKKNQEILLLQDEVNFLKKYLHNKKFKNKSYNCQPMQSQEYGFSSTTNTSNQPDAFTLTEIISRDITDLFQNNTNQKNKKLLNSVHNISKKWALSIDSIPKYNFKSYATEERAELIEENIERVNKTCSIMDKSPFHHFATNEVKREEKIFSKLQAKEMESNGKWKKALNKYKELKKLNPLMFSGSLPVEEVYQQSDNKETEFSEDNDKTSKIMQQNQILKQGNHKNAKNKFDILNNTNLFTKEEEINVLLPSNHINNKEVSESLRCQNSGKEFWILKSEENRGKDDIYLASETNIGREIQYIAPQSPEGSRKVRNTNLIQNSSITESNCGGPSQENYFHSLDSSFDSDYGYPVKQEVQQVQVEVQINSVSLQSNNDRSGNKISETNQFYEYDKESNVSRASEPDFNDDDDVIICEK